MAQPCKVFTTESYSGKILQNLYDLWQSDCFCDLEIRCDNQIFNVSWRKL